MALAIALFTHVCTAAEPAAPANAKADNWWTDVSITPYGAVKHPNFGAPIWGGGLEIGYQINRTVRLSLANTIFDAPPSVTYYEDGSSKSEEGWFAGSALDETEVLFRADLIKGGGDGKDRFVAFLIGSGSRDWEREDWAFGVGVGSEIRFTKNLSVGVDSRIRAWFNNDKDLLTRGFLSLRF